MKNLINNYNIAFEELVKEFTHIWMMEYEEDGIQEERMTDEDIKNYYYIIGGTHDILAPDIVSINEEYYFSIQEIWGAIKHNIPMSIVQKWYHEREDHYMVTQGKDGFPNLFHYWRGTTVPKEVLDAEHAQKMKESWESLVKTTTEICATLGISEIAALESIQKYKP